MNERRLRFLPLGFLILALPLVFAGFSWGQASLLTEDFDETSSDSSEEFTSETLIILGEGGTSESLFVKTAVSYQRQFGGEMYEVHSGDEFVSAVEDFLRKYDRIDHFEYFGHGNHVALFVNQEPGVNGGVYANDPSYNEAYLAASIYELPSNIFVEGATMKFNGCNIADGYPQVNSLAQSFANHFDTDVVAALGPTEFSSDPYFPDPLPSAGYLPSDFDGDIYLVPTYTDQGFTTIEPQLVSESAYLDVRVGQSYEPAVLALSELGLELPERSSFEEDGFYPYLNGTYADALAFCELAVGERSGCELSDHEPDQTIRNLQFLKMLVQAYAYEVPSTYNWYQGYINWANERDLLTTDFIYKRWYTRGEMAELAWNFYRYSL